MSYTPASHLHVQILALPGRFLGSIERKRLRTFIERLLKTGHTRLVVDLSETTLMDSTGLGLLVHGATLLRQAGGDLRLGGLSDRLLDLFTMTRLMGTVFDYYETPEAALRSFCPRIDTVTQGHSGTLSVEGDVGQGAAFVVTLPAASPRTTVEANA